MKKKIIFIGLLSIVCTMCLFAKTILKPPTPEEINAKAQETNATKTVYIFNETIGFTDARVLTNPDAIEKGSKLDYYKELRLIENEWVYLNPVVIGRIGDKKGEISSIAAVFVLPDHIKQIGVLIVTSSTNSWYYNYNVLDLDEKAKVQGYIIGQKEQGDINRVFTKITDINEINSKYNKILVSANPGLLSMGMIRYGMQFGKLGNPQIGFVPMVKREVEKKRK